MPVRQQGRSFVTGRRRVPMNGFRQWRFCEDSTMEVQPDFKELLALFNKHVVECVIASGHALAFG
jgi:hypothetical protein